MTTPKKEKFISKVLKSWLLAPAFGIALLGHIPNAITLYQSIVGNIPYSAVSYNQEQAELWKKNSKCYKDSAPFTAKTKDRQIIRIYVCPDGDVLVELQSQDDLSDYTQGWISRKMYTHSSSLINSLYAQSRREQEMYLDAELDTKVCFKTLNEKFLIQIVKIGNNCHLQQIDLETGRLIKVVQFPKCPVTCQ
jgi:hypothetical protein